MAKYTKRKDGFYETKIDLGRDKKTGKRVRYNITAKTIAELERKKAKAYTEKEKGKNNFNKCTFQEYSKKWLDTKSISIEHSTLKMYTNALSYCKELEDLEIKKINRQKIQEIINLNSNKPRTCQKIKITLNQIFEHAVDDQLINQNPCKKLTLPRYEAKESRGLTSSEEIISELADLSMRERLYIDLLKFYGFRKEEALALSKNDFDFKDGTIDINKALAFKNNQPYIKTTKTKAGKRKHSILDRNIDFFKKYIKECKTDYLFSSIGTGELISEQSYRRMFEQIIFKMNKKQKELDKQGIHHEPIKNLTSKVFRHNYATKLYYGGVGVKEAQYLMGHSNIKVTLGIYTHLEKQKKGSEIHQKLNSIFK